MKTTKIYSAAILILTVLFVTVIKETSLYAAKDIDNPPTTYNEYTNTTPDFDFDDEAYIDDIPFDTECVSKDCVYEKAVSKVFELPEESTINDIPFNTAKVARLAEKQKTINKTLELENEEYVDDIPFSTLKVVCDKNSSIIFVQYQK
jgi:hypothetical protein